MSVNVSGVHALITRGTKLVATLGPSTNPPGVLRALIDAGLSVARFNFSHGSHPEHLQRLTTLRQVAREAGRPVGALQDLSGPKVRTTDTDGGKLFFLARGDRFTIVSASDVVGDQLARRTGTTYTRLAQEVKKGDRILLSDGLIAMAVREVNGIDVVCEVLNGGTLKPRQGINLPGVKMGIGALTDKDKVDLRFGLEHGMDWVALSFVRSADDVRQLRQEISSNARELGLAAPRLPRVMAKIEKPEALDALEEILNEVDGVMVARGDLGVEMLPEQVPIAQKRIVLECNRRGIPVVVATQMLESMIQTPRPTRAEVSDVCNAIFDGADACMLSGETASGAFPVEAAQMMTSIACMARANPEVDTSLIEQDLYNHHPKGSPLAALSSIGQAATSLAASTQAKAIVVFSYSGRSALKVAQNRPRVPIIAFTRSEEVARQLVLSRNVIPTIAPECKTIVELADIAVDYVKREGIVSAGDTIVLTASHPLLQTHLPNNFVKVITV
eukprot:Unigene7906_Nuclearia_a/m.24272 Unigene7906_Nuclearia_a/g.24272  ORF Unigene7906_Nuclearia_a/g.24272 Unigene7906_Nuclearia_a/m.24272 type:complete len:502 (+) Unigene7906_Nuclearia_a:118-1623(+)